MSKIIDQKEYLKKYLSSDDKLQKKKKKKSKETKIKATVKIIDDDAYVNYGQDELNEEQLLGGTNEELPQIVGVIDERAPNVIMKQEYVESGKWKAIAKTTEKSLKNYNNDNDSSRDRERDKSPKRRKNSPDSSPRRKIKDSSDASPPRRIKREESSPPRKRKNSSDISPPRRRRNFDESPPRRKRRDSSDASPPRRMKREVSPPRRKRRNSSDASPPRRIKREESPPRRKRRDSSDASPPRRIKREESPRRKIKDSPPRKSSRSREIKREKSPFKNSRWSNKKEKTKSPSPPPTHGRKMMKTLDGKSAGLQNAQDLKRENEEFRARQDRAFKEMGAELSGKNADVVIRDRRGRNKEFEFDAEKERKKLELEEARKKEYDRWGKGLKQQEELEKKREEYLHEASKPLARFEDDDDLQKHLKERELVDDPMLMYMRKKKQDEKKSRGELEKPQYKGEFPDNRFHIRPGYRWDGVDRSNGYESKYFMAINSKKSLEEEAYRYSTEDM